MVGKKEADGSGRVRTVVSGRVGGRATEGSAISENQKGEKNIGQSAGGLEWNQRTLARSFSLPDLREREREREKIFCMF